MSVFSRSIRMQLFLIVLICLIPVLGMVVYSGMDRRKHDIDDAQRAAVDATRSLAIRHEHAVASTRQFLMTLARLPDVQNQNAPACNRLFTLLLQENQMYATIFTANEKGMVTANALPFTPFSIGQRDYFQNILRTKEFSVGEFRVGTASFRPVLPFAYPVADPSGRFKGVVVAGIDLFRYGQIFALENLPKGSVLSLTDHRGIRIYRYPDPKDYIGKPDDPAQIRYMTGSSEEGTYISTGTDGVKRLYAFKRLSLKKDTSPYLFIRVGVPEDVAVAGATRTFWISLALIGLAFIAALLLTWFIGKIMIAKRLDRLVAASRHLTQGDLTERSGLLHTRDELGQLARSFDEMADQLEYRESHRRLMEESLRQSEESYRLVVENAGEAILIAQDGMIKFINPYGMDLTGYSEAELVSMPFVEFIHPDDRALVFENYMKRLQGEDFPSTYHFRVVAKDNAVKWVEISAVAISWRRRPATLNFLRNITEQKRAELTLRQSEERYRTILEEMEDGYQEVDLSGNFTFFNESFLRIFGYSEKEMMGTNFRRYAADEENAEKVYRVYNRMFKTGVPLKRYEWDIMTKDGIRRSIEFFASLLRDAEGHRIGFRGIVRDVTEQKQAEEQYRIMANSSQAGVYIVQDGNLCFTNPHISDYSGYPEAELMGADIRSFVHPDDREMVTEKAGKMLRGELFEAYEYRIIDKNGRVKWLMETVTPVSFKGKQAVLGNTMEITDKKASEEMLVKSLQRLRRATGSIIDVIIMAVETRDPYTSGHQRRVANLARAIATVIGLPAQRIEGLRVAGAIHDLGKISIPAEILSMPRRLTEVEYGLVKTHAEVGYNILKDIEFDWPIAEMVLQHHERMDGTGYPRGLRGNEICMEARILSVSDVVESIATHRPYRPALGIEAALNEISTNRGVLYDPTVVDACLTLFREKNYELY